MIECTSAFHTNSAFQLVNVAYKPPDGECGRGDGQPEAARPQWVTGRVAATRGMFASESKTIQRFGLTQIVTRTAILLQLAVWGGGALPPA
jgi:hypothetical protein